MRNVITALLLVGGILAGCSSREDKDYKGDTRTTVNDREDWNRMNFDPVCGHFVNPKTAIQERWDNASYYFDSEECRRRFLHNPTVYVPGAEPTAPVEVK